VDIARFAGPHPAGLPGTHLDCLHLRGRKIWQIGYQDVIAIGHLRRTGETQPDRIVALGGPMARNPRLVRTRRGANLADLTQDETRPGEVVIVSGSALSGRPATHLGHLDCQICLLPATKSPKRRAYAQHEGRLHITPMTPTEAFEGLMPQKILCVPLMRALAVGNWDMALGLGAFDLVEEDVALLSALCTSGLDYGVLLRRALSTAEGAPL
jgi:Na+-transporting NADH:ubiquinone oxidoreductase subunit A